ncbi:N-acetylglucosamine-6-phosphate deacetylase [Alicyclobacillus fastidiosus]|uniref:Amidohydrolase family protein n=1 Tax=Alicyclobacillus fastidiosus TaxID=392011 RepID=A0ABV5AEQ0_9BACL|nr:amidohydrolase family protein [Alicyclobacillus fastidiosus]WEH09754.1 amidohydrolase family protein [Alicyclobacillus fastidiosus]
MESFETQSIKGLDYRTGRPIEVEVLDGVIRDIRNIDGSPHLPWLAPGFVDLQVNGFRGVDLNSPPLTSTDVMDITQMLWREGVTAYLPTVITNSDEKIEAAVRAIAESIRKCPALGPTIPGIHLEGPFISPQDGPRGAHHHAYVKAPDWALFERWQKAADGRIRVVTISPEWPNAAEFIARCVSVGVRVAIGHTSASTEQIAEAVRKGASASTHLGNGAHPVLPRHPNYIWDQLAEDDLWSCLIGDGFHLPDSVLKVMMRVKRDKAILVSDMVDLSGLEPGEYKTHIGGDVVLTPEGKLHLKDQPLLLAGSVQTQRQGVWNLQKKQLCGLREAWDMASVRPATYLDLPTKQGLEAGAPADIVVFELRDEDIQIVRTVKQGFVLYEMDSQSIGGNLHG